MSAIFALYASRGSCTSIVTSGHQKNRRIALPPSLGSTSARAGGALSRVLVGCAAYAAGASVADRAWQWTLHPGAPFSSLYASIFKAVAPAGLDPYNHEKKRVVWPC